MNNLRNWKKLITIVIITTFLILSSIVFINISQISFSISQIFFSEYTVENFNIDSDTKDLIEASFQFKLIDNPKIDEFSKVTYNDFNGNKQYEYFAKIDVNEKNVNEIRKLNKTMYKGNYGYGDSIEDIKFFNWWQLKEQSIDFELLINWYNYGATITTTIYCCKPENGKVVMYIRSGSFI